MRRAARVGGLAFVDRRAQARAPGRQRLVRLGQSHELQQVLVLAQPFAQPLRLADPHLAEAPPQRHHRLHLVAVGDDVLAQFVQVFGARVVPILWDHAARGAVAAGKPRGDLGEGQHMQRPELDGGVGMVEPA